MKVNVVIERLRRKWFPSTDDKVWKQWVDYKERETRDLVALLNSDIRESLKRRVIFLLLVPSSEFNPIYWTEEVGKFYHNLDFLKNLNPDLLAYATDLVVEFNTMLKPMHRDKPENFAQGGSGITIFWSVPGKYHSALYFYNSCILLLLTLLSEKQCERIFPLFSLRDISTYCNMEDSSGYNPFQSLLSSDVDERWKIQADAMMRQIINNELAGKIKPREDWENALKCYAHIIMIQLYSKKLHYSVELFADQIQFLVSGNHYKEQLIEDWKVAHIFQILSGDTYKEVRRQVAEFIIFGNKNDFNVWSEETMQGAQMILDEFGQENEKLAKRIQLAIADYDKKTAEAKNNKSAAGKIEDEIMAKMK